MNNLYCVENAHYKRSKFSTTVKMIHPLLFWDMACFILVGALQHLGGSFKHRLHLKYRQKFDLTLLNVRTRLHGVNP